ncbi:hypothetical protein [Paenibacillus sp. FSL W7-1287]|uniref:hypothetical protein n=1 Tax=Paenibacillus sp. FSL W7-1287 TaxID=2954538 RepID=UPI0030F4C3A1
MVNDVAIELLEDQRILHFAKDQFMQQLKAAEAGEAARSVNIFERVVIGTFTHLQSSAPELASFLGSKINTAKFSDEFVLHVDEKTLYIIGVTPRAALYAVYHYFEIQYGMHWIYPGQPPTFLEQKEKLTLQTPLHVAPLVERRGLVIETIDDLPFIEALIDWLAKHKINELFFTFTLWDKIGSAIQEMILDRGIDLTLGGHSTSFFLKQLQSIPAADHPYTAKQQLDYSDLSWQDELCDHITLNCHKVGNLKRISLWPEDIKHQSSSHFLTTYIGFTERLQQKLHRRGLSLEVEHIAYNAGLAWDMLERQGQAISSKVNTLFAYWGRDYSKRLDQSINASDKTAYTALIDWQEQTNYHSTKLTIFEYYSDHFMLSPLFPMLAHRIAEDIKFYVSLGVHGITNLIVPSHVERYSYQWNQNFNCYVFARSLWNHSLDDTINLFIQYFPSEIRSTVRALLLKLEQEIAILTRWNVPFFPARAVDPLKTLSVSIEDSKEVVEQLDRIIKLVQTYLNKEELKSSLQLNETLLHYERYAESVKEQWLSLSN